MNFDKASYDYSPLVFSRENKLLAGHEKNRDGAKAGMKYNPYNKKLALNIMQWLRKRAGCRHIVFPETACSAGLSSAAPL